MIYKGQKTKEIIFPIGGIGSGSVGICGDGRFRDWEIFNRPNKGSYNAYSHFAVKAKTKDGVITKMLHSDAQKEYTGPYNKGIYTGYGHGMHKHTMAGMPHFKSCEIIGEYPFAKFIFKDDDFPATVALTAFNPFIPLDSKNSSIPAAFFEIEIINDSDEDIEFETALSLANPYQSSLNTDESKDSVTAIKLSCADKDKDDPSYGDMCIATDHDNVTYQQYWYRGQWGDALYMYWKNFNCDEVLKNRVYDTPGRFDTATIVGAKKIASKASQKFRYVMAWNSPTTYNYQFEQKDENGKDKTWKNYYATVFEDSVASAMYSIKNWDMLYSRTLTFKETLFNSTVPDVVKDAVSANISVLKSPTVIRLEDGSFYGWEGTHEEGGSCHGTCQHVWNYAYALCFLFPDLERSIRDLEFKYCTYESGETCFRLMLPPGVENERFRPCADGQLGTIIKTWREWKISGDNDWLKNNWPTIQKIMDFTWSPENKDEWDINKIGVLTGRQHHTLDMELFGPSSWLEGFYLAALQCASEMASFLGLSDKVKEYDELFEKGYKWTKENLFNGKYFIQKIDLSDKSIVDHFDAANYWNDEVKEIKYQIGQGSEIDQMCAQWHCNINGLNRVFDKEQTDIALDNMMKNNYVENIRSLANLWRLFAVNDEAATVICAYPEDVEKPAIPILYCEESMHGFEYQFAGLLISEGRIDDGLKVIKAVRDRYDGEKRNPFNEVECGNHYARSMASFAFLPLFSGYKYDLPNHKIGFDPIINQDNFSCLWSIGTGWGNFSSTKASASIDIIEGSLELTTITLPFLKNVTSVLIDGKPIDFKCDKGNIIFDITKASKEIKIN